MGKNNLKVETNSQHEEGFQTIEIVVHLEDNGKHVIRSWQNKTVDVLAGINEKSNSGKTMFSDSHSAFETLKKLFYFLRGEVFSNYMAAYIYEQKDILDGIKKYPKGGSAVVAYLDLSDESQTWFRFYSPEEVNEAMEFDYTVIPFIPSCKGNSSELDQIELTPNEQALLTRLGMEYVIHGGYLTQFSNERISEISPEFRKKGKLWAAETLGKLFHYGLIDIELHTIGERIWRREILIKDSKYLDNVKKFHACLNRSA